MLAARCQSCQMVLTLAEQARGVCDACRRDAGHVPDPVERDERPLSVMSSIPAHAVELPNSAGTAALVCLVLTVLLSFLSLGLVARQNLAIGDASAEGTAAALATFAGVGAFFTLLSCVVLAFRASAIRRSIEAIRRGEHLAHWTYSPDEWRQFQEGEAPRVRRDFYYRAVLPTLIALVVVAVCFVPILWGEPDPGHMTLVVGGGTLALVLGLMAGVYYFTVVRPNAWARRQGHAPPDSFLHPDFFYANGRWVYLSGFGRRLVGVAFIGTKPPRIEFTFAVLVRGGEVVESQRVLVPAKHGNEALRITREIGSTRNLS
jgi:hypothetical protein